MVGGTFAAHGKTEQHLSRLHFLPDVYDEESIYLRSSDYIRTQESVQQLVAGGLYPIDKRPQDVTLKLRIRYSSSSAH